MKTQTWRELAFYQSGDYIETYYKNKHNHKLNKTDVKKITAAFIQAQAYFENAQSSPFSVKPLLQFYGVFCLSKGLALILDPIKKSKEIKGKQRAIGHGLEQSHEWTFEANNELSSLPGLKVKINSRNGLYAKLLKATENISILHYGINHAEYKIQYPQPSGEPIFSLNDIIDRITGLELECYNWRGKYLAKRNLVRFEKITTSEELYKFSLESSTEFQGGGEFLMEFYGDDISHSPPFYYIKSSRVVHLSQIYNNYEIIGKTPSLAITYPLEKDFSLNDISLLYAASFILGALVRYHASVWISIDHQQRGDGFVPVIKRLSDIIQERFPALIAEFLKDARVHQV